MSPTSCRCDRSNRDRGKESKVSVPVAMSDVRTTLFASAMVLALGACSPAGRPVASAPSPLFVPPLTRPTVPTDPLAVRFAEGAAPPSGCFAVSRRTGAVACALGQFGERSDSGQRHLSLLQSSEEAVPDLPLRVQATGSGLRLEPQSRLTLDSIMREGDFVALGAPLAVPLESPRSFGGMTVELRRASTALSEELPPNIGVFDLEVIVQVDARAEEPKSEVLLQNTLTSVACLSPSLTVRVLEPRVVLIERECRLEDGGVPELLVGAWLCDSERARCE